MRLAKKTMRIVIAFVMVLCIYSLGITVKAYEADDNTVDENEYDYQDELDDFEDLKGYKAGQTADGWLSWTNGLRGISYKQSNGIKSIKFWIDESINYYYLFEYNREGYLVKCTTYTYGEAQQFFTFEYDANGNLTKITNNSDGNILSYSIFEYNNTGCLIKESYYSDWGNNYTIYEYDANGNLAKENGYDSNNKLDRYTNYEYNAAEKLIKASTYLLNYSGTAYELSDYMVWEYSNNGNISKIIHYLSDGSVFGYFDYEYDGYGRKIRETNNGRDYKQIFEYDENGNLIEEKYIAADGSEHVDKLEFEYYSGRHTIQTAGIYCASNYPSIQAGINIQKSDEEDDVEYRWVGCNNNDPEHWFEVSPWTKNNNWMDWIPQESGGYVFVCYARIVGKPETEIQFAFGTEYHKQIKGICQMPYTGEGGGYLIGIESYDNPNHAYQYEMLILDCNLYMQGKDAWVYTTGRCGADGNCLWTVWQPQYGYYWTLFRIYDSSTGELIDEACYGFENVN